MWISQRTGYALRAMLELARRASQPGLVRASEISAAQGIPPKFLELILVDLRNARLISSHRGAVGGHRLARAPRRITVGEILYAVDNPLKQKRVLVSENADPFAHIWDEINDAIASVVDRISLEEVEQRLAEKSALANFVI